MLDLFETQMELENEMTQMGVKAYRSRIQNNVENGMETNSRPMQRLLDVALRDTINAIEAYLKGPALVAGPRNLAAKFLKMMPPEELAFITSHNVLASFSEGGVFTKVASSIGRWFESEMRFKQLRETDPGLYKVATRRLSAVSRSVSYRTNALRRLTNKIDSDLLVMTQNERTNVGAKLLELFIQATGFVQVTTIRKGKKTTKIVSPAPRVVEWLDEENARCELFSPHYMPMLVEPLPWTSPTSGGYLTGSVHQRYLVRTYSRSILNNLKDVDMPEVYAAVNAVQATPWRINRKVLAVMDEVWEKQLDLGVLPPANEQPYPDRPEGIPRDVAIADLPDEQRDRLNGWRKSIREVRDSNVRGVSKRVALIKTLWTARKYAEYEEIFFPHNLDFRGRIYPIPTGLQPQGDDLQRGLLEFANGVAIADEWAETWFFAHGAGLWGVDKVSLEERAEWVWDHRTDLMLCAADPLAHRFWLEAEKPWQALAFCFDLIGYLDQGLGYVSHLPIQMDGSCNGLQNFSAILRDERGGRAVNLIPQDQPSDIYSEVAEVVNERVRKDAQDGNELAAGWIGRVDRKVVKRPVMTLPYGATRRGYTQQLLDDTVTPMSRQPDFPWENTWAPANYLGGVIWDCVGEVVVAARAAMDWIQDCSNVASAHNEPLRWTTPVGLPVLQDYRETVVKKVELTFMSKRLQLHHVSNATKLNKKAQRNGSAPNFIHSLDAAHLMRTVNACHDLGIRSFSLIHDSYGTHAGNAMVMATVLREEFVKMYSDHEVLEDFRNSLLTTLPEGTELPPVPPKGNLDLQQVLDSPYFFA